MIKSIHLRIFSELIQVFLVSLGALLSLILIGRMLQLRELFLAQNLGFIEIMELFVYLSPFFLLILVPIACMLSVFLTFLRMSSDRELIALKAGGVSLYQLLHAPVLFCLLCTAGNFWVAFDGISWGIDSFKTTVVEHARTRTRLMLQPGVFNRDFPGMTLFAQQVDPAGNKLGLVFVRDATRKDMTATIIAPEGYLGTDTENARILFYLKDGHIYREQGESIDVLKFAKYAVSLDLGSLFRGFRFKEEKPKEMSWQRLHELENDPAVQDEDDGLFVRKIKVEIQKRLALPLACLVLGLFSLPFAFAFEGVKRQLGLAAGIVCFFFYYTLLSVGISLGETGLLTPRIGLWIANGTFFAAAIVGIRMAANETYPHIGEWLAHIKLSRKGRVA